MALNEFRAIKTFRWSYFNLSTCQTHHQRENTPYFTEARCMVAGRVIEKKPLGPNVHLRIAAESPQKNDPF